jgi:hypothetical protein
LDIISYLYISNKFVNLSIYEPTAHPQVSPRLKKKESFDIVGVEKKLELDNKKVQLIKRKV